MFKGAVETVIISVVLELDYSQYLEEEELVIAELKSALKELGLEVATMKSVEFGHKQWVLLLCFVCSLHDISTNLYFRTQVVMSVYSPDSKAPSEGVIRAMLEQLKFALVSVKIGNHEELKSSKYFSTRAQQTPLMSF